METAWITVVETKSFIARAKDRMTREEIGELIKFLAKNPEAGDIMEGTGGVRKVRYAIQGRGKSGGVRVIYYIYNEDFPLFLLTVFAKNEKSNLTKAERNALAELVDVLVETYKGGLRNGT